MTDLNTANTILAKMEKLSDRMDRALEALCHANTYSEIERLSALSAKLSEEYKELNRQRVDALTV